MALAIEKLEEVLAKEPFVGGNLPSEADRENFEAIKEVPDAKFPNARAWYLLIKAFSQEVRMKWGEKKKDKKGKKDKDKKDKEKGKEKGKEEEKEAEKGEMDEGDLFGEGNEEEAQKIIDEKKKKDAEKKKEKKKEAAKSYIRFEVKVHDTATNLDDLAARIYKEVNMDGLRWEKDYSLEPFAYGVNKLVISCVIEDDKVSSDDIIETITGFDDEELVQSVDILVFNKL